MAELIKDRGMQYMQSIAAAHWHGVQSMVNKNGPDFRYFERPALVLNGAGTTPGLTIFSRNVVCRAQAELIIDQQDNLSRY